MSTLRSKSQEQRSRRDEYSEATRRALISSAVALITERGYAAASLDAVAERARVTKGALYHHFAGKRALFRAAFDAVETDAIERVVAVVSSSPSPWQQAIDGLNAYLEVCLDPSYQRIVMREGPAVLGVDEWAACEEQYSLGLIRGVLSALMDGGEIERLPLDQLTSMLFSALGAGASQIAGAADPERVSKDVGDVLVRMLEGLRPR